MTIQQLYYVLEVARTGSLNRAAKELFVSQSCISVSIRKLEQELGFPIFIRSANGAFPTEKGQRLIGQAGNIMASLEQISKESDPQAGQETSAFSISLPHKHPNDSVVSIPFACTDRFTIGVLYSQIRGLGEIGQRYTQLFKEELSFLSQFS